MKKYYQSRIIIFCLLFSLSYFGQNIKSLALENNKKSVIKVGVYNNPPQLFINNSNPKGIFIDIIGYISEKEKLDIEYIPGDWASLLNMLKEGEIDILPSVIFTKERDSIFCLNELPILTSWLEVYTTDLIEINSVSDLKNKKIGVLKNSIEEEYLEKTIKTNYNISFETIELPNYQNIGDLFKNKDIEVLIAERFISFSEEFEKEMIQSGISFKPVNIHFAFSKESNNNYLVDLFDKYIYQLRNDSDSIYYSSLNYWLYEYFFNFIPSYILWTIYITFIVIAITCLFLVILKHQVNRRTKALRLSNESLIKATEAAQESVKLKSTFLHNISHEIRTPMNGILGFMDLLKEPDLDSETRNEYINIVNRSGKRLLNTVNDILEISKIEIGNQEINIAEVNIEELMQYKVNFFKPQAGEKGLILRLSKVYTIGENALIQTDNARLGGIIGNLLNNAIKFTERGSIELGNYRDEDSLVFYVKDTGIGIPEDRLESIFNRFIQAENKLTRNHEGVGLGLAIAKAHVEAIGGIIWVYSEKGKGSTFFFSIPYLPIDKEKEITKEVVNNI